MSAKVEISIIGGSMKGRTFAFEEHDTFLFGRLEECHCCLSDDQQVSRRHFIIEVNPPDARIRDFGSLNGTHLNNRKIGSRKGDETPEEGQRRQYPELDLQDGDIIEVGQTVLVVTIPVEKAEEPILCARCGNDVAVEIGGRKHGSYVCLACRQSIKCEPAQILFDMLAHSKQEAPTTEGLPTIAGFRLKRRIGVGGFGAVYLAERESDKHPVAIKVMLARVAVDDSARRQFAHEVSILKDLRHQYIVNTVDSGSAGMAFYFVMEFCPGGSVADYMVANGNALSPAVAMPIMIQVLEGLAFAHGKGVVHRDLKPSNVLLAGTPAVRVAKISDLGLAKSFDKAGFSGMTVTGAFAGTPLFMPKEQLTNFKYVEPVTDVWSAGATFYNMLTGETPRDFPRGCDPLEVILRGDIIPISKRDPQIPSSLASVLDRALQAHPKDRYQDAEEMLAAMKAVRT